MSFNRIANRVSTTVGTVRSTSDVIAAILANRRPEPAQRRGMNPRDFLTIGHG